VDTIKRRDGNYKVYTKKEAKAYDIKYRYWKNVYDGEYGLSDDGYVGKCIRRATYTDKYGRTKTNVKMCYGTQWISNNSKLLYEPNKDAGVYSHVKPTHWIEKEKKTTRAKEAVAAYVAMKMADGKLDWEKIGQIYRPDQQNPAVTAKRLFKTREIKDMVEEKIKELLTKKGVTKDSVLDLHIEAAEMAKEKGDVSNMLKVGDVFMDLLEMKPNKKITTDTVQLDVTNTITKALEQEDKRVLLERKVEDAEHPDSPAE
jgi:hypothetical protein|tara:strand:+ start:97 stop:870 length:774 start_codon:yes stop_codon:yes gene_type:complete